jgi:multiple sugar transport system permease protein
MSKPLIITLIGVSVNLGGTLVIYSFMAFFLTRLQWRDRGALAVLMTIIIAEVFWILPTIIGLDYGSYSFFFGNWLVSAFSVVLFCQTAKRIPRQLEDSARLDGCGWFGTYWHVVLPLVRRDLGLIALLLVMATTLPFLTDLARYAFLPAPPLPTYDAFTKMLVMSGIATVPVIAIFLIAKRRLRRTTDSSEMPSGLPPH